MQKLENESQKIMSDEQKYLKILNNMKLNQVRFNYNDKLWQFNDFDFDEEEKDLSGGKERSYVPLRFSTVKSEEETAAEEAKEDVPAVEEVKGAVSPAAEGKEETPAPEPKEEEKEKSAETEQADDEPFDEEDEEPIDNVESSTETIEEFFDEEEDNK